MIVWFPLAGKSSCACANGESPLRPIRESLFVFTHSPRGPRCVRRRNRFRHGRRICWSISKERARAWLSAASMLGSQRWSGVWAFNYGKACGGHSTASSLGNYYSQVMHIVSNSGPGAFSISRHETRSKRLVAGLSAAGYGPAGAPKVRCDGRSVERA